MKIEGQGILSTTTLRNIRLLTYLGGSVCLGSLVNLGTTAAGVSITLSSILIDIIFKLIGITIAATAIGKIVSILLGILIVYVAVGWWADYKLWKDGPIIIGEYLSRSANSGLEKIGQVLEEISLTIERSGDDKNKSIMNKTNEINSIIKRYSDEMEGNVRSFKNTSNGVTIILFIQFLITPIMLGVCGIWFLY